MLVREVGNLVLVSLQEGMAQMIWKSQWGFISLLVWLLVVSFFLPFFSSRGKEGEKGGHVIE